MSRRGENIIKRKDGRWEARVAIGKRDDGKTRYKYLYAHSYKEVRNKKEIFCNSKKTASIGDMNIFQAADDWLNSVKIRCKSTTYSKYRSICNLHIIPFIGKKKIGDLTTSDVAELIEAKSKLSVSVRRYILCVLKMILEYAAGEGYVNHVNLKAIKLRAVSKAIPVLSPSEQHKLSDFLIRSDTFCSLGIYLCLCTGLRLGEICALKLSNISFESAMLFVSGTLQRVSADCGPTKTRVVVSSPKTQNSKRTIPINQKLLKLIEHRFKGLPQNTYILSGSNEHFIEPRTLENRFKKCLSSCGIGYVNFHVLRHTFATRCIENGMDIKTLSEILGHSCVNITLQRYVHSSEELKRRSMDNVASAFD